MRVVTPIEPYVSDDTLLLALCVWREARGESIDAKRGVVHTILNRMALAPMQGFKPTIRANILKPWAFSSFMQGDPNSTKYPKESSLAWHECLSVARVPLADPTRQAVFYYSLPLVAPPRQWGPVTVTVTIGGLTFCRL